jgi:uncharacterized protein
VRDRETLSPIANRVALLDVLRGFASLGILLFNIIAFSGWVFLSPEQAAMLPVSSADSALMHGLVAFIEGKFYSLFSLLFGIGFAIIVARAEQKDAKPAQVLMRRYFVLLCIGLVHAVLIWFGDILVLYALLGFLLIACRGLSDRALIRCAIALFLLPIPLYGVGLSLPPGALGGGAIPPGIVAAIHAYASGSYTQIVAGNLAFTEFGWLRRLILMFYPRVFGMFLLGVAFGRMGVFQAPEKHASLLRAFSRYGLLIGLPACILYSALDQHAGLLPLTLNGFLRVVCDSVGSALLCLGYVAWMTRLFQRQTGRRWLLWFAPVGRMALSNYLLQSVLGVFLFYGIGGGLFGRVSLATSLGVALLIYASQVLMSRLYLSAFEQWPVESVWRRLTYGGTPRPLYDS